MRAVRFHEYGPTSHLRLEEIPRPEMARGEVLVEIRATAVHPYDAKLRLGRLQEAVSLTFPHLPGIDFAGTVVEAEAEGVAIGDRVFGAASGTYAEFATASPSFLAGIPGGMSFEEAATLPVGAGTALIAVRELARVEPGQSVLIQGAAGGVGMFAVQLAHHYGARVIATASKRNSEFVRAMGASAVIDYSGQRFEEVVSDLDVVIDAVGGDVQDRSWQVLRPGGILIAVAGSLPSDIEERGVRAAGVAAHAWRDYIRDVAELASEGVLRPEVGRVFSLENAAAAHEASETGHSRGRILLEV